MGHKVEVGVGWDLFVYMFFKGLPNCSALSGIECSQTHRWVLGNTSRRFNSQCKIGYKTKKRTFEGEIVQQPGVEFNGLVFFTAKFYGSIVAQYKDIGFNFEKNIAKIECLKNNDPYQQNAKRNAHLNELIEP